MNYQIVFRVGYKVRTNLRIVSYFKHFTCGTYYLLWPICPFDGFKIKLKKSSTVKFRFKKDLNLQIYLPKTFS